MNDAPARRPVLIVDNDALAAADLARALAALGYAALEPVTSASSASFTVEAASAAAPGVVLMDVDLAGTQDECRAALRRERDVPVIYLAARDDDPRLADLGATRPGSYLRTPVDPSALRAALELAYYTGELARRASASDARFRAIAASSPVPLVISSLAEQTILFVNDAFHELLAWRREDVLGRRTHEFFVNPADQRPARERLLARGRARADEVPIRRGDGGVTCVLLSANVAEYDGAPAAYTCVVPIDERREAEAALRAQEQRMRLALLATELGTFTVDVASGVFQLDALTRAQLDFDTERVTMADLLGRIHPDDRSRVLATIAARRAAADEVRSEYDAIEHRVVHRDGSVRWLAVHVMVTPSRDAPASARTVIGTTQDVTARREADETLRRVVAASPAVIYAFRWRAAEEYTVWVSENVAAMTGWSVAEASAAHWWADNLHPDDRARVLGERPQRSPRDHSALEFRFRRRDGNYIWIHDERKVLRDGAGAPVEVVGSWLDVTARVALEQQLVQAQKMEGLGRLAGGVAHDFNNLLTVISGNTELLAAGAGADVDAPELLEEIRAAAARATELTRQLLAFSRAQVLSPRVLDINAVLRSVETMLRRLIGEDVVVETFPAERLGRVFVDPVQLEQVVLNLAVNARDAMPKGGHLVISTHDVTVDDAFLARHPEARPGRYVLLRVSDDGVGMSPEVRAHAFEPFFTTKPAGKGTGLGLATVFGIVTQSGGLIELESEPGRGARFDLYFPASERRAEISSRPSVTQREARGGDETILLAEDEPGVRQLLLTVLERRGYHVLVAHDGAHALELAAAHAGPLDLLVTDIVMPRVGGRELAEKLRALRPGLRVLFMSGYIDDEVVRGGLGDERESFLSKPFTPRALEQLVREVLDGAR